MEKSDLNLVARQLVSHGKGLLAADESDKTIKKRFDAINLPSTLSNRNDYREMLFKTPGIEEYISGVILFDETIRQADRDGIAFTKILADRGIIPGIKVDLGTTVLPETRDEKITLGLDNLQNRIHEYYDLGARFAKWRAVFRIEDDIPTKFAIDENARALAEYALICQNGGIVPIVEPEVLMDGSHSIERCSEVTRSVLIRVFEEIVRHGVRFDQLLLKPNMIVPGIDSTNDVQPDEIAQKTVNLFREVVPVEVPGIVFLSGGEEPEEATEYLSYINRQEDVPWVLTFSFGRALQDEALHVWSGVSSQIEAAQSAFLNRARLLSEATKGTYTLELETK